MQIRIFKGKLYKCCDKDVQVSGSLGISAEVILAHIFAHVQLFFLAPGIIWSIAITQRLLGTQFQAPTPCWSKREAVLALSLSVESAH